MKQIKQRKKFFEAITSNDMDSFLEKQKIANQASLFSKVLFQRGYFEDKQGQATHNSLLAIFILDCLREDEKNEKTQAEIARETGIKYIDYNDWMTKKLLDRLEAKKFVRCKLIKRNHKKCEITEDGKKFLKKVEELITLKPGSLD